MGARRLEPIGPDGTLAADRGSPGPAGPRDAVLRRAVAAAGPPGAPPLVLLHGSRRTRSMWRPQLEGLADAFRVIAVDLPAHGALADLPFRLEDAADIVAAVIDAEGGGRAIVAGSSLGGYVAIDLAARHSRRVSGLVLAGTTAEPRAIARRAPRTVGSYLLAAAGERLLGGAGRPDDDGAGGDGAEPAPTNGWLFKGGTRALVAALGTTFLPRLASYPGPVLIVNGATDAIFRRAEERFVAAARDARLVVIPGTGHLANEEQPLAFNAAIREFAAVVVAGGTRVQPRAPAGDVDDR